jgi:uncharacterized protein
MEISNLSGNISEAEGKLLLHMHITLGRKDYTALAGHLLDAKFAEPANSSFTRQILKSLKLRTKM